MLQKFKDHIETHKLCQPSQQIMLAVSGGIDSVVMCELFYRAGYECSILHCNFRLRGEESDGDEAFVRSLAASFDMPVYVQSFETEDYARDEGLSVQMAARKLRYDWFNEVADQAGIDRIATAHNMNDNIETFLLNLVRGSGIKGLSGIPVKNGKYIRPMLEISREEIISFSREQNIGFREDSSNSSKKYKRNKIRHDVIPLFEEVNPSFIRTMNDNISRISEANEIFSRAVADQRSALFRQEATHTEISVDALKDLHPLSTWIYELFSAYGFSKDQCSGIEMILNSDSGRQCISTTHRLYKDRDKLLLFDVEENSFDRYYIDAPGSSASLPFAMDIDQLSREEAGEIPDSPSIAFLDYEKLKFPLTVRKWQHGDYFCPLGMDQMKKLSDFFIDAKVPVPVKNRTWILASGKDIVWIMGLRIDNRYRIEKDTKQVLRLRIYEQ